MDTITFLKDYLFSTVFTQLLVSAALGLLLGFERELAGKDPGLRTFTLIAVGSCAFTILSVSSAAGIPNAEPSRIAAQIIPGVGFLGAGAIFRSQGGVAGLTTAALMWVTAGIGMAVGFERMDVAIGATIVSFIVMFGIGRARKIVVHITGEKSPED